MSTLILFHFKLQSFNSVLKMDLRLKLEFHQRILKKYSCVTVCVTSIGFSQDLACWKEDRL